MEDDERREFNIGPSAEMKAKYGWHAESRPVIRVEISEIPANLVDLIPVIERWAIQCDITRHDYFEKQSSADVRDLARTVGRRTAEINAWLDSLTDNRPKAADHFMFLLKAWCEAACAFPEENQ